MGDTGKRQPPGYRAARPDPGHPELPPARPCPAPGPPRPRGPFNGQEPGGDRGGWGWDGLFKQNSWSRFHGIFWPVSSLVLRPGRRQPWALRIAMRSIDPGDPAQGRGSPPGRPGHRLLTSAGCHGDTSGPEGCTGGCGMPAGAAGAGQRGKTGVLVGWYWFGEGEG